MSIEEKNLILPALYVIKENGTINTTNLIKELEILFKPSGEDAEILRNRRDTKFSQKVRNLKSHRETNNMWQWTNYKKGIYSITNIGREYLNANISAIVNVNEKVYHRGCGRFLGPHPANPRLLR